MKRQVLAIYLMILMAVFSSGCKSIDLSSRLSNYEEMSPTNIQTQDFSYTSINPDVSGVLKGKTHEITSTVTFKCRDKDTFDKVDQKKDVLLNEVVKIFKRIKYTEIKDLENYESLEQIITKKIEDKLFIDVGCLMVELSDIVLTELK